MLSSSLTKQLQKLNLPEDVVAKVLFLMKEAYQEGYSKGCNKSYDAWSIGW